MSCGSVATRVDSDSRCEGPSSEVEYTVFKCSFAVSIAVLADCAMTVNLYMIPEVSSDGELMFE